MELSPRQREVCELVAKGKTEAEIGTELGISIHTVKVHKTLAYRKLGVRNAVEMTLVLNRAA
jgi:DNA-binding CsgD family transcriptional regulator